MLRSLSHQTHSVFVFVATLNAGFLLLKSPTDCCSVSTTPGTLWNLDYLLNRLHNNTRTDAPLKRRWVQAGEEEESWRPHARKRSSRLLLSSDTKHKHGKMNKLHSKDQDEKVRWSQQNRRGSETPADFLPTAEISGGQSSSR